MELKDWETRPLAYEHASFNRTFMELKGHFEAFFEFLTWFQSHLYGIERSFPTCTKWRTSGFNRTFMELKVHVIKIIIKSNVEFQSHLYGIERTTNLRAREGSRVSIAPLWN